MGFLHTNDLGDTIDETGRIVNPDGSEASSDDQYHQKCGCGHLKIDHFATGECCFSDCDCEQFDIYDYMLSAVRVPPEYLSGGTVGDRPYSQAAAQHGVQADVPPSAGSSSVDQSASTDVARG